jgi:L-threonylcarbamoyladenylate synthase
MIDSKINTAVKLLKQGEIVAYPTDTVYGLGADASNEQAILKIFATKKRDYSRPLVVHIPSLEHVPFWADTTNLDQDLFESLVSRFWPGALTIVLKKAPQVSNLITSNQETIGLRIPNHPVALDLLMAFNSGIVGTSANISGNTSLISNDQVAKEFNNIFILENSSTGSLGIESTIISLVGKPTVLRQGAVYCGF